MSYFRARSKTCDCLSEIIAEISQSNSFRSAASISAWASVPLPEARMTIECSAIDFLSLFNYAGNPNSDSEFTSHN